MCLILNIYIAIQYRIAEAAGILVRCTELWTFSFVFEKYTLRILIYANIAMYCVIDYRHIPSSKVSTSTKKKDNDKMTDISEPVANVAL